MSLLHILIGRWGGGIIENESFCIVSPIVMIGEDVGMDGAIS